MQRPSGAYIAVLAFCAVVQGIIFGTCQRKNPVSLSSMFCHHVRANDDISITVKATDIVHALDGAAVDVNIPSGSSDPCRSLQGKVTVDGAKQATVKAYYANGQEEPWNVVLGAYQVNDGPGKHHYELCYDITGENLEWDSCVCS